MKLEFTNKFNIPPIIGAWLVSSNYGEYHKNYPNHKVISATTLIESPKKYILKQRLNTITADVSHLLKAKVGTTVHDSLEHFWTVKENYKKGLELLNTPKEEIDNIIINPTTYDPNKTNFIIEKRFYKELPEYPNHILSGQVDLIIDGTLYDYKSTSTYTYTHDTNKDKYIQQGSIYRYLAPELITEDIVNIVYIFNQDWTELNIHRSNYPQSPVVIKDYPLMSLADTAELIHDKLSTIISLYDADQSELPDCTNKDLWRDPTKYKYYKDPAKINDKCTKNFDEDSVGAYQHLAKMGVGVVKMVEGTPKACLRCPCLPICEQGKSYFSQLS